MEYEKRAREINTEIELDEALAAGAFIEFTCCYGASDQMYDGRGVGGWVTVDPEDLSTLRAILAAPWARDQTRAFYPVQS